MSFLLERRHIDFKELGGHSNVFNETCFQQNSSENKIELAHAKPY